MAAEWWWFLVLNAIVAVIAVLSKVGPSSPRGGGFTRRASSAALQRLRSSIFSFPSSGFQFHTAPAPLPQSEAAAPTVIFQETEEPAVAPPAKPAASTPRTPPPKPAPSKIKPPTRVLAVAPPVPAPVPAAEEEEEDPDDPNAMSMDEAYARIVAARKRQESEREEDAGRSDVDAKAEEFIQGFKEDLRQQRLNSIFNYTQMLKKRAFGDGRKKQPAAHPNQP